MQFFQYAFIIFAEVPGDLMICVREIIEFTSLKNAEIAAGSAGLDHPVEGFAVLEYPGNDSTSRQLENNTKESGKILVISSFSRIVDDIEEQRRTVRDLRLKYDASGLILFYVGVILPEVDRRVLEECEKYALPLIVIREDPPVMTYASLISEVTGLLYRDKYHYEKLTLELIDVFLSDQSAGPVDVLNRIREKTGCLLAFGKGSRIADCCDLPDSISLSWEEIWNSDRSEIPQENLFIRRVRIENEKMPGYELLCLRQGSEISDPELKEISTTFSHILDFYGHLWAKHLPKKLTESIFSSDDKVSDEFIRSFGTGLTEKKFIWMFMSIDGSDLGKWAPRIISETSLYGKISYLKSDSGNILVILNDPGVIRDYDQWVHHIAQLCAKHEIPCIMVRSLGMNSADEIRSAYNTTEKYLKDACVIFRDKEYLEYTDVCLARLCRALIINDMNRFQWIHQRLTSDGDDFLMETICTYYLDTKASITETAQKMYLHRNTVKYRLKRIGEFLGCSLSDPVVSSFLIVYGGMCRLLKHDGYDL